MIPPTITRSDALDYGDLWAIIQPAVWTCGYDLAELRGAKKRNRRLDDLRFHSCWLLAQAGYSQYVIADFLFVDQALVQKRLASYTTNRRAAFEATLEELRLQRERERAR